jgi:hypothetical protein
LRRCALPVDSRWRGIGFKSETVLIAWLVFSTGLRDWLSFRVHEHAMKTAFQTIDRQRSAAISVLSIRHYILLIITPHNSRVISSRTRATINAVSIDAMHRVSKSLKNRKLNIISKDHKPGVLTVALISPLKSTSCGILAISLIIPMLMQSMSFSNSCITRFFK